MATAKVGAHPPSSRIRSVRSSRKNRLNGIHSGDPLVAKSQLLPNYSIFQTPSPSNHSSLSLNRGTGGGHDCLVCVQCQGSTKAVHHGLFSFFYSLQQNRHQTWLGSGKVAPSDPSCTSVKYFGPELLVMPVCSHYDVQMDRQSQNCAAYSQTDHSCELTGFSISETAVEEVNNAVTSLLPGGEGVSRKCSDIISGSHDDEIVDSNTGIHAGSKGIHADECSSEYCSDLERCDDGDQDDDEEEQGHDAQSGIAVCLSVPSESIRPIMQANGQASLSVNHPQLKKLLSDESGYYENVSADFAVSPCEWSQKAMLLTTEDIEEWEEWDDEESAGADDKVDEAADILWKSFEDCMLSPQTLNTKGNTKTVAADSPANVPTADTRNEGLMQLKENCRTTGPCNDRHPKQNTHVQLHAVSPSHMGTPCPPVAASKVPPCRQVLFDHVTADDSWSCDPLEQVHVEATEASFHPSTISTGKQVRSSDPVLGSQPEVCCCNHQKQVRFPCDSSISVVHKIVAWNYAYRAARKGPWEVYARNRAHFRRKIDRLALVIEPCLAKKMANSVHSISR